MELSHWLAKGKSMHQEPMRCDHSTSPIKSLPHKPNKRKQNQDQSSMGFPHATPTSKTKTKVAWVSHMLHQQQSLKTKQDGWRMKDDKMNVEQRWWTRMRWDEMVNKQMDWTTTTEPNQQPSCSRDQVNLIKNTCNNLFLTSFGLLVHHFLKMFWLTKFVHYMRGTAPHTLPSFKTKGYLSYTASPMHPQTQLASAIVSRQPAYST